LQIVTTPDEELMDALWQLAYWVGPVRLEVGGGHDLHQIVACGGQVFHLPNDRPELLRMAALRDH
jgi:hypothetical protein